MKIDKDFFKDLEYKITVDITGVDKLYPPYYILPRHLWLQDITFGWTKEEIEQADYYIGNKYGIDCYITNPIKAISK